MIAFIHPKITTDRIYQKIFASSMQFRLTKAVILTNHYPFIKKLLEVISKPQIMFESKAQADEKAQHTREYVSILKRFATQF
jgi:hypothetical protein